MLWIGDRTRYLESEHLEFASMIDNPIGIKIGPSMDIDDLSKVYDNINPNHEKGKMIFITRLGNKKIEKILPQLINKV